LSYCRFGEADAYIYDDVNSGLVCMACLLMPIRDNELFPDTFIAGQDRQKMLDHIAEHRYIGDHIPLSVDGRLRKEMVHDDLCPQAYPYGRDDDLDSFFNKKDWDCRCELINEIRADERTQIIALIEELPCKCEAGGDYCDGHTDAINAIEAIDIDRLIP